MLAAEVPLPLFTRAIFVDWHGVLSRRLFWSSLDKVKRKELQLSNVINSIFRDETVQPWMKGHVSTYDLLTRYFDSSTVSWLEEVIVSESRRARLNRDLIEILLLEKADCYVVLASDNMDCFAKALESRRGQIRIFDDFLVSSELGVLKGDPREFFGPWLRAMGLDFSRATLIDDDAVNVAAFREAGGHGVLYGTELH